MEGSAARSVRRRTRVAGASAGSASRSVRMRWSRSRRTGSTAQRRPPPLPIPQAAAQPSDRTSADPPPATGRSAVFGATCGQAMAEQQRALGGLDPSGKGSGVWPKRTPGSWRLARAAPQNDPRPALEGAHRPLTDLATIACDSGVRRRPRAKATSGAWACPGTRAAEGLWCPSAPPSVPTGSLNPPVGRCWAIG